MTIPLHDFADSLTLARTDADLLKQLALRFKTGELSAPNTSHLVAATADSMTWVIQMARSMYKTEPERLNAVLSSSMIPNALAVWSSSGRDWIVFSEGLMVLLRDRVDSVAGRFQNAFPDLMNSKFMQPLLAQSPLRGGFPTALSSFLYFSAIAFLTGHEAGHHLAGHKSQYPQRAHAEASDNDVVNLDENWLIGQSLERDADLLGMKLCRNVMTKLLLKLFDLKSLQNLSLTDRKDCQHFLAALISTGALTTALFIRPTNIDWSSLSTSSHPPAVARILTLSVNISNSIETHFHELTDVQTKWIRMMSLEIVVGATINPGTEADRIHQERLARGGEPAAIRATGIRKALHDPQFQRYMDQLDVVITKIRPHLEPRM